MRKQHNPTFKALAVLEVIRANKPLTQIAAEKEIHPTLLAKWRDAAYQSIERGFQRKEQNDEAALANERKIAELYEQIGRLTLQRPEGTRWLKKKSGLDPDTL
jgi:transposase